MKEVILSAKGLCKSFAHNGGQLHILSHLDFDLYQGDFTVIMGASGSGKSTLLYALSGMDRASAGEVIYAGADLVKMKERDLSKLRHTDFGFIFQQMHLVSNLTLFENVAVPGYLNRTKSAARPYTALDIVARKRRMQGYNVLYPMGWDAFGLPTENYAIQNHIHPRIVTENNVIHFKNQLHALGYSFDWDREINTTDPDYYKWTQWIFLKLFKAGLAYKSEMPINWCTSCKVGLANEEVVNGVCERCGSEVVRKVKSEWMLKITNYADKLLEGLNDVDYIERVKTSQRNWIGRSEGAEVDFSIAGKEDKLRIYNETGYIVWRYLYGRFAGASDY